MQDNWFRAVRKDHTWFVFDRGERPDIDGFRYSEQPDSPEPPARTSLPDRLRKPVIHEPVDTPIAEVIARIEVEYCHYELGPVRVPWLETRHLSFHPVLAHEMLPDGARLPIVVSDQDFHQFLNPLAAYLDHHNGSLSLGQDVRHGPKPHVHFVAMNWPILATQLFLFVVSGLLLCWPFARRQSAATTLSAS